MVYSPVNPWTFPVDSNFPWLPAESTISTITQGYPCIISTTSAHGYMDGLVVQVLFPFTGSNNFGMMQINGLSGPVSVLTPTSFSLPINTVQFDPFNAGSSAVTNISQASQAVVTVTTQNFQKGQIVSLSSVVGMIEVNGLSFIVSAVSGFTVTLNVDSTLFTPYSGGGIMQNTQAPLIIPIGNLASYDSSDFTQVNPVNPNLLENVPIFQKPGLQAAGPACPS